VDDGGGTIANNLVHDISQTGIYGRHWKRDTLPEQRLNQAQPLKIEFNEIHDVMLNVNDGGGIFIRDSNILINNNLIYNVHSPEKGSPGWGIYLGCETRYSKVTNNVVYNTIQGVHVWYASRYNTIENNIFVDCDDSQIWYQAPADKPLVDNKCLRNVFYNSKPDAAIFEVQEDYTLPSESDYNLIYMAGGITPVIKGPSKGGINTWDGWLKRGYEKNSIVADPKFKDPANRDYTLLPESPAFKLGFKAIDLSTVGLRGSNN
jgi:parallel beta-helix repeat protein